MFFKKAIGHPVAFLLVFRMNGLVILLFSFSFETITIFSKKSTHMK